MNEPKDLLIGELVDDQHRYTLREICDACGVTAEAIIELVEHGVLEVQGGRPSAWRFSNRMLIRSRKARRLQRDLELNVPGLALCLELLDEVEALHRELSVLRRRERSRLDR